MTRLVHLVLPSPPIIEGLCGQVQQHDQPEHAWVCAGGNYHDIATCGECYLIWFQMKAEEEEADEARSSLATR